jgi:hypothetical protein
VLAQLRAHSAAQQRVQRNAIAQLDAPHPAVVVALVVVVAVHKRYFSDKVLMPGVFVI